MLDSKDGKDIYVSNDEIKKEIEIIATEARSRSSTIQGEAESVKQDNTMSLLVLLSILLASANIILYKMTLNSFSSSRTNYGFFVSQFSTFLYLGQAIIVSVSLLCIESKIEVKGNKKGFIGAFYDIFKVPQYIFFIMGFLDAGSSTLGTIAGAYCPGELQTLLNQSIIPITLVLSTYILNIRFKTFQIIGSFIILFGAGLASSGFLFSSKSSASSSTAIIVFSLSIIPSGISNVYKESIMKKSDLNEVHTSMLVSLWQLILGFLFLPLLFLPALSGSSSESNSIMSLNEIYNQMSDGYKCFLGENPTPYDSCENSWIIMMLYIIVNFAYNVLLLIITKRGSAVLLVISQALALPTTNIAFTIPSIVGLKNVEPMSMYDLSGLVLVCIGFLTYSGFGYADSFMVAQGPPGQMAYAQVDHQDDITIPKLTGTDPEKLSTFLIECAMELLRFNKKYNSKNVNESEGDSLLIEKDDQNDEDSDKLAIQEALISSQNALDLARRTVSVLRQKVNLLSSISRQIQNKPSNYLRNSSNIDGINNDIEIGNGGIKSKINHFNNLKLSSNSISTSQKNNYGSTNS